jgi:SAM-dependent methyltransferase
VTADAAPTRASVLAKYAGTEVPVVCPFCGADDAEPLLGHERYGTGLPTVICRRCCLIYLGRRWPDDVYRRFYEADYRVVDEIHTTIAERYAEQLAKSGALAAFCGPYLPGPEGSVLDVGASAGGVLQGLAWATGCRAVGVEPSEEESELARSRGIDVRTGTLETVELEPASFDLALLVGTIDHLFDPFGELRRIRALLKPTGALYVSISDFVELAKLRRDPAQLDHLTYYTSETLRDLVQQVGFQAVRWRAPTAREAEQRHRDEREHVGPVLAMQALFRVEEDPVLFARPDWRRIKAELEATRRLHEPPPLARRILRRVGALDGG